MLRRVSASLAERRGLRLFTFCVLYCAQGIPWGFTAITLPALLADRHMEAKAIGTVVAMTTLPYTFKLVWGPVIDALPFGRFGRRRPWIIIAQAMMALTILAMILLPELIEDISLLAAMVFVNTMFSSIQDVATDALAVDLLDEDERGRTNGFMYASKYFGGLLGGKGISYLIDWTSLRGALIVQGGALLVIMLVPLLVREQPAGAAPAPARVPGERWRELRAFFASKTIVAAMLGAVVMLLSNLAGGLLSVAAPVLFTQDLQWSVDDYLSLAGGWGVLIGAAGSVLGGLLADRVGHKRLAILGALALAAYWLVWAALARYWGDRDLVYAIFWIEPLCQSVMVVSLFAICMDLSWPKIAASQFGTYMALANFSTTTGAKYAGVATDHLTFTGVYIAAAVLQAVMIGALLFVDTKAVRTALPVAETKST